VKDTVRKASAKEVDWRLASRIERQEYKDLTRGFGIDTKVFGVSISANYDGFIIRLYR